MRITRRTMVALTLSAAVSSLAGCRRSSASEAPASTSVGMRAGNRPIPTRQSATADDQGRSVRTLDVGGVRRRYIRLEPPGLDPSAPVPFVLLLHGATSTGAIAERLYGMSD